MFNSKWIFKDKSFITYTSISNINKFPNGNILLIGENIYIYDSNLELIYSKTGGNDIYYMNACIINNDSFIVTDLTLKMTFYSKVISEY